MDSNAHTITTAKGTFSGDIREVCEWQAKHQAAFASVDGVSVDHIDFDADDIDDAVEEVIRLLCRAAERAAAERAEQRADAFRAALGAALDRGVYFEVSVNDDSQVVVVLGDREERGYDAWQSVNFAVGEAAESVGLEFHDSGPAQLADDDGEILGGEYHQYDIR